MYAVHFYEQFRDDLDRLANRYQEVQKALELLRKACVSEEESRCATPEEEAEFLRRMHERLGTDDVPLVLTRPQLEQLTKAQISAMGEQLRKMRIPLQLPVEGPAVTIHDSA